MFNTEALTAEAIQSAVARSGLCENSFTSDDQIDENIYNWYVAKFAVCREDGVLDAVNCYVHHACNREDINDITKVAIMQASLHA